MYAKDSFSVNLSESSLYPVSDTDSRQEEEESNNNDNDEYGR